MSKPTNKDYLTNPDNIDKAVRDSMTDQRDLINRGGVSKSQQKLKDEAYEIIRMGIDLSLSMNMTLPQHEEHIEEMTSKLLALIQDRENKALDLLNDVREVWHQTDDNGFAESMNKVIDAIQERVNQLTQETKKEI